MVIVFIEYQTLFGVHTMYTMTGHTMYMTKKSTYRRATRCSCLSRLCGVTSEPVSSSNTYIKLTIPLDFTPNAMGKV